MQMGDFCHKILDKHIDNNHAISAVIHSDWMIKLNSDSGC